MFTKQQKYVQGHRSAQLLESRGHFASSLAKAFYHADMTNAMRLRDAFPEFFQIVPIEEEKPQLDKSFFIDQFNALLISQQQEGHQNG